MLSYLHLKNFKSFADITLDLRGPGNTPKQTVFIYGENGSGKSNLMSSLLFLSQTMATLRRPQIKKQEEYLQLMDLPEKFKNLDFLKSYVKQMIQNHNPSLKDSISEFRMLNSNDPMFMEIGFFLMGKEGTYTLEFQGERIVREELRGRINQRVGTIFLIDEEGINLSPSVFKHPGYGRELSDSIRKYWGKHTFMSILFNERSTKNVEYFASGIASALGQIMSWFNNMSLHCNKSQGSAGTITVPYRFMFELEAGTIADDQHTELEAFERGLNLFFTHLYSDIKQTYYKTTSSSEGIEYQLYIRKTINGKTVDVPFALESTGTRKLLAIFPFLFMALEGVTVLIDELDSGIHDLLMFQLIDILMDSVDPTEFGQLIATTHNTQLMKNLPKENVYVIRSDVQGKKSIISIDQYPFRTQAVHNVQSKYLQGDYDGVPYVGALDFQEVLEEIKEHMESQSDPVLSQEE